MRATALEWYSAACIDASFVQAEQERLPRLSRGSGRFHI
jgi:hypothetical protein